jgi:hypothetical protein
LVHGIGNMESKLERDAALGCPNCRCQRSTEETEVDNANLFVEVVEPTNG